jgi:hypothetical protein
MWFRKKEYPNGLLLLSKKYTIFNIYLVINKIYIKNSIFTKMKSIKNMKLNCTMKYLLTLFVILCILYISYYFYNKNNYEHLSIIASTHKSTINMRFRLKNIGSQRFNYQIYRLNYDLSGKKLTLQSKKGPIELAQNDTSNINDTIITSGNIGYFIVLTPNTSNNSDPLKNMDVEITPCLSKDSNTFNNCDNTKIRLLSSDEVDNTINNIMVAGNSSSNNFTITSIQTGNKSIYKFVTKKKLSKYGIAFLIK